MMSAARAPGPDWGQGLLFTQAMVDSRADDERKPEPEGEELQEVYCQVLNQGRKNTKKCQKKGQGQEERLGLFQNLQFATMWLQEVLACLHSPVLILLVPAPPPPPCELFAENGSFSFCYTDPQTWRTLSIMRGLVCVVKEDGVSYIAASVFYTLEEAAAFLGACRKYF